MFRYIRINASCAFAICSIRLVICVMSGQPRRDTRDTLMTSTVSRVAGIIIFPDRVFRAERIVS